MEEYGFGNSGSSRWSGKIRRRMLSGILTGAVAGILLGTGLFPGAEKLSVASAQDNWSFADTLGVGIPFDGVDFISPNEGWVSGSSGVIIHTTDAGKTWKPQNTGTTHWIHGIHFVDSTHGWAAANNGLILATKDGGKSWDTQNAGIPFDLYSVTFTDPESGWVSGFAGTLLHTTDGGKHWTKVDTDTAQWIMRVFFLKGDPSHGWAVGQEGLILATTDGGATWKKQNNPVGKDLYGVNFVDANRGWVVGTHGVIEYTTNGGQSWTLQNGPGQPPLAWGVAGMERQSNDLHSVVFLNDKTGYVVGVLGTLLKTVDGGAHWALVKSGTHLDLYGMDFPDGSHGWVVGVGGMILHS